MWRESSWARIRYFFRKQTKKIICFAVVIHFSNMNMLQNNPPEEIVIPADLRNIPKPKSFNKRKDKNDKKKAAPEYHAPQRIQREVSPNAESDENRYLAPVRIQPEMEISERQEQEVDDSTDDPDYRTFLNPQSTSNDGINQPRRSSRVPLLSAKALENLVDKNQ